MCCVRGRREGGGGRERTGTHQSNRGQALTYFKHLLHFCCGDLVHIVSPACSQAHSVTVRRRGGEEGYNRGRYMYHEVEPVPV